MTDSINETRAQIRKSARALRQGISAGEQNRESLRVCKLLCQLPHIQNSQHISLYLANDGELDLAPFIQWCWKTGKNIYLPVIHPFSKGHLLFLRYQKNTILQANKYGILEPKLSITELITLDALDIIFTPLVAFDGKGNRLGMGGGFYDRTLENWYVQRLNQALLNSKSKLKFIPIGLAHNNQKVSNVPSQSWDVPLPQVITPSQVYHFEI